MKLGDYQNMAKKRKQLVEEIMQAHESMYIMLLRANISDTRVKRPIDKMDKKNFNDIRKLRTWICKIHVNEYEDVVKVWNLLPEEKWNTYLNMEIYDMEEQRLLREANRKLDAAWGHKPKRKKGAKRHIRKETNSVS